MKRVRVALVLVGLLAAKTTLAQPPARPQRPPDPRTAGPGRPATAKSPAQALLDRAIAAEDAGRHQEALGLYDQALVLDPKEGIARHLRGGLRAKMGDCKGAIVDLDAAEEALIFEDMLAVVGFFATRGDCHFDLGDYPAAIEDFERQVRNETTDHYSWSMLGFAYSRAGRHADALPPLRKAIELAPKSTYYLVLMGEALSRAKSHDEALDYYRRALTIDPNYARAHRAMSLDYVFLNRLADARTSLQAVLRLDPTDEPMRKLLASVEADLAKAAAAPTPATATRPAGAVGRTVAAAGTPQPAPPQARTYPPVDPRSTLGRGIRLYLDVEYQQAVPVLIQATKENPSDPRGFAYLAAAYFKLGVTREFEAARDRAVALDPGIMRTVP